MLKILDVSLNFSSDIPVLRCKDWNQRKKLMRSNKQKQVSPNSRVYHFICLVFSMQAQYRITKQTRSRFIFPTWKGKPKSFCHCNWKCRFYLGKKEAGWYAPGGEQMYRCENHGKTHSCWGSSSTVFRIPRCGNSAHKLELHTKALY